MAKAWKIHFGEGKYASSSIRYDQPTEANMVHYAKHNVTVEEIEIKGPVYKIHYVITDGGDGEHGVEFYPSRAAINEIYDDDGFPKGEDAYMDVPVEVESAYIDLSDYEVVQ